MPEDVRGSCRSEEAVRFLLIRGGPLSLKLRDNLAGLGRSCHPYCLEEALKPEGVRGSFWFGEALPFLPVRASEARS